MSKKRSTSTKTDGRGKNKGGGKDLTFEERKELERFAPLQISAIQIAAAMGRGKNTIAVEYRRAGGREGYNAVKAQSYAETVNQRRADGNFRVLTPLEEQRFKEMMDSNLSYGQIREEFKINFLMLQRYMKKYGYPALSLISLAQELESRLYVVEEHLKLLTEMMEKH